jgi:prepilin-type N-terminal cleavage/methylation domain-containing protein
MRKAFSLIELLVVVAIIAILASIAVVNFAESQTRAKVASSKNTLRVLAEALETYHTDSSHYPPASGVGEHHNPFGPFASPISLRLIPLTTPVAYLSSVPHESFTLQASLGGQGIDVYDTYDYLNVDARPNMGTGLTSGGEWRVAGIGPDCFLGVGGIEASAGAASARGVDYDPTNGTNSTGDLVRTGALCLRYGDPADLQNPLRPGILRVPVYREQYQ